MLLLAAAALGGYLYERHRTGSIYHPHARFVPAADARRCRRAGPTASPGRSTATRKDHTRFFPAPRRLRPPFKQLWAHNARTLLEFPPVIYGDHIFQLADDGVLTRDQQAHRAHFWSRRLGVLSASTPAVVGHTVYATVLASGQRSSPGRVFALDYATRPDPLVARPAEPERVLAAARPRPLFFGSQSGLVYALERPQRERPLDLPGRRRGQGQPDALERRALLRRLLRARPGDLRADRAARCGSAAPKAALLGSGTFYSTAGGRLRPRLPRQHRRAHLRLRRRHRQARLGRADRRLRLLLARRHRTPPASARPSTSAPTTARSTRSTPAPGQISLEVQRAAGASPARRRSSGASCTSPTSATTAPTASASPPAACSSRGTPARSTR